MKNNYAMHSNRKKPLLIALAGLLLLACLVTALELANVTHIFHKGQLPVKDKTPTIGGASENVQKGDAQSSKAPNNSPTTTTQPGDNKGDAGGGTAAVLLTPSGTFVSNHRPNLGGLPAPNTITSVCTTTPGATCTITFTKDGTVKQLDPRTADSEGSVYWNWKLQDIGLTTGSWKIKAVATLNGGTKTAADSLDLTVSP
jgi:hypothetical protein